MKVLMLEDEPAAARKLRRLLEKESRISEIFGPLDSVESALEWVQDHPRVDLLFSDIELADGLSFELFRQWPACPPIIFVSAYDQYALQAFKAPGVDYLLKPVQSADLRRALDKFEQLIGQQHAVLTPDMDALQGAFSLLGQRAAPRRFLVRFGEKLLALPADKAAYYQVEERLVVYTAPDGKKYPLDYSLDEVEGMLDPAAFFRINRQFIVGLAAIVQMEVVSKSRVRLRLQPPYPGETIVSTDRSPHFKEWIKGQ